MNNFSRRHELLSVAMKSVDRRHAIFDCLPLLLLLFFDLRDQSKQSS
jgi:hypothetical protein